MKANYYSLTFLVADSLNKKGKRVLVGSDRKLFIGTSSSADLPIGSVDSDTEMLTVIKPTSNGDGWCLLNLLGSGDVKVGGRQVMVASALSDGCHVQLCDTELLFCEHKKSNIDANQFVVEYKKHSNILSVIALCLVLAILGLLGYLYYTNRGNNFSTDDEKLCSQWIYRIKVDSIFFEKEISKDNYVKIDSVKKETSPVGTCFIARDKEGKQYLITARHCIEPWLETEWEGLDTTGVEPELCWAIAAENSKYKGGSKLRVTSLCKILDKDDSVVCILKSSGFIVDRRNDQVINMSLDRENPLMLRSITPLFHDHSMEMGDIAFIESPIDAQSQLLIADDEFMNSEFDKFSKLHLFGFPQGDKSFKVEKREGMVSAVTESPVAHDNKEAYPEAFWCIVNATPGFSGGPMVAKYKDCFYVLGLLSYLDPWTGSHDRFRIIPASVITRPGVDFKKLSEESLKRR